MPSRLLSGFSSTPSRSPRRFQSSCLQRSQEGEESRQVKPSTIVLPFQHEHLFSDFCPVLITSPRWLKLLVNTLSKWKLKRRRQKSKPQSGPESYLSAGEEQRYCILTPHMLQPIWKKTALINRLHCAMKLLFEPDNGAHTVQHRKLFITQK